MEEENILESIVNYLKPKAHDAMNAIMDKGESIASRLIGQDPSTGYIPPNIMDLPEDSPISQEDLMNLVMGISGGGGGKGISKLLLAMKGKIKDGKMIPQQPFRQGMVGKPKPELVHQPAPEFYKNHEKYGRI